MAHSEAAILVCVLVVLSSVQDTVQVCLKEGKICSCDNDLAGYIERERERRKEEDTLEDLTEELDTAKENEGEESAHHTDVVDAQEDRVEDLVAEEKEEKEEEANVHHAEDEARDAEEEALTGEHEGVEGVAVDSVDGDASTTDTDAVSPSETTTDGTWSDQPLPTEIGDEEERLEAFYDASDDWDDPQVDESIATFTPEELMGSDVLTQEEVDAYEGTTTTTTKRKRSTVVSWLQRNLPNILEALGLEQGLFGSVIEEDDTMPEPLGKSGTTKTKTKTTPTTHTPEGTETLLQEGQFYDEEGLAKHDFLQGLLAHARVREGTVKRYGTPLPDPGFTTNHGLAFQQCVFPRPYKSFLFLRPYYGLQLNHVPRIGEEFTVSMQFKTGANARTLFHNLYTVVDLQIEGELRDAIVVSGVNQITAMSGSTLSEGVAAGVADAIAPKEMVLSLTDDFCKHLTRLGKALCPFRGQRTYSRGVQMKANIPRHHANYYATLYSARMKLYTRVPYRTSPILLGCYDVKFRVTEKA
eukprot:TRINITY_DN861_c0_g1_i1.p1 TRINITY_DN861_c0_g1~~TRINITY_DN861_c0_g1_i1.p1  ORF type:complete len:527 (+),score=132.09 TRINITY_DN861_c0_g1_i1:90-1670(+)